MDNFEERFYRFMEEKGYIDTEENVRYQKLYLQFFNPGERVLDVGCGQGEFLALLRDKGCRASGVDADQGMVEACLKKGLRVDKGDALAYLAQEREAYDVIFAGNFVEHLTPPQTLDFLEKTYKALKSGGRLVLTTPNPESIVVHLHEFWRDGTHQRLYQRSLLEFMLSYVGFEIVASGVNEATEVPTAGPETPPSPPAGLETRSSPDRKRGLIFHLPAARPGIRATIRRWIARFLVRTFLFEEFWYLEGFLRGWESRLELLKKEESRRHSYLERLLEGLESRQEYLERLLEGWESRLELLKEEEPRRDSYLEGFLKGWESRLEYLEIAQGSLHAPREIYVVGMKP